MNKNKLPVILEIIDNLGVGGAQNMLYELVSHIDKSKYEVVVLCYGLKQNSVIEQKLEAICKVIYCSIYRRITIFDQIKVLHKISKLHPSVVHAHLGGITFGMPWCLLHHKPIVITPHTIPEKAFSKRNEKLLRHGLKRGKVSLVAVSENNYQRCLGYYNLTNEKCTYINNGIDLERFYDKKHQDFTFINVGTHNENKNQLLILRCFSKLREKYQNIKLILVGDGPTHAEIETYVKDNHLDSCVELPGQVSDAENYYAVADVYVQSSYREAMPLSILEAMAAKLPIISTNVGGISDVIKGNGILVNVDSEEEFLNATETMINMKQDEINAMKEESFKIVQDYSSIKMADNYTKVFDELINK